MTLPVSLELLKAVPGRYSKILNGIGGINEKEFDEGQSVKLSREPLGPLSVENRLGRGTLEAANHGLIVTSHVNNVKRYHGWPNDWSFADASRARAGRGPLNEALERLDANQAECVQHAVMSRLRATSTLFR